MKTLSMKILLLTCFICANNISFAQDLEKRQIPDSISISKNDFENLFKYKANTIVKSNTNSYLNNAVVLLNNKFGSNKQLKLKLENFPTSYLIVQVNGDDSILIFIISDDKSVFYKNKNYADKFVLVKCAEDDIISE